MPIDTKDDWDTVASRWEKSNPQALWRVHSDSVNAALLKRWLPADRVRRLLKTDLFDEAFGRGLHRLLAQHAMVVIGMDSSAVVLKIASKRNPDLQISLADARQLPFRSETFDLVFSNSTLDHFGTFEQTVSGICEIVRILRPGGQMLLTLDNLANPVIAVRNLIPYPILKRLRLVPYPMGPTCGPRRLRRIVANLGMEILETTAIMHCPRVLVVPLAVIFDRFAGQHLKSAFLHFLMTFESLERLPTRSLTGHFVAIRAVKSFPGPRDWLPWP